MHINAHCLTPEKMALTLLDSLFPREVLAVSNLSGKGKHSKRQLDPLLVSFNIPSFIQNFTVDIKNYDNLHIFSNF